MPCNTENGGDSMKKKTEPKAGIDEAKVQQSSVNCYNGNDKNWVLSDFDLYEIVGKGKFTTVYQAREKQTFPVIALKVLFKTQPKSPEIENQVKKDVEIYTHLSHPNILKMYGLFHDKEKVYLVLEYADNGDVFNKLKAQPNRRFDETRAATYISQLADALKYCHSKKIVHRDIKPQNLLLGAMGEIKLADFGYSVHVPLSRSDMSRTLNYKPPEIILGAKHDYTVHSWGVGVLCYEFLAGQLPFLAKTEERTCRKIMRGQYRCPPDLNDDVKDLISQLLVVVPDLRLSSDGILSHPWIVSNRTTEPMQQ